MNRRKGMMQPRTNSTEGNEGNEVRRTSATGTKTRCRGRRSEVAGFAPIRGHRHPPTCLEWFVSTQSWLLPRSSPLSALLFRVVIDERQIRLRVEKLLFDSDKRRSAVTKVVARRGPPAVGMARQVVGEFDSGVITASKTQKNTNGN